MSFIPNRKIKEGYHTTVVETKDNRTIAAAVRDAGGELVLRDPANKLVSIPKIKFAKECRACFVNDAGSLRV